MEENTQKNILVLGGGFGGLHTVLHLERLFRREKLLDTYTLFLVDEKNYHLYTPTLYEIATTLELDTTIETLKSAVTIPFHEVLEGKNIEFIKAEVRSVDIQGRTVLVNKGTELEKVPFTFLVLALGSETNYFDIPGLREYSLTLKNLADALRLRNRVHHIFLFGEPQTFIIGGGGTTGIELTGELTGYVRRLAKTYNRREKDTKIVLVESADQILIGFEKSVVRAAHKRLQKLGVEIRCNTRIEEARAGEVRIKNSTTGAKELIPASTLIWTGGIKVNPIIETLTVAKDKKNRCLINTFLEIAKDSESKDGILGPLESHPHIYAIGDNSCFYDAKTGFPVPANAPYAITQGEIAAKNILAEIQGTKRRVFQPKRAPFIIPIGGKYAIADLGFIRFKGISAWVLKQLVEPNYFRRILPWHKVIPLWLRGLWLFIKND